MTNLKAIKVLKKTVTRLRLDLNIRFIYGKPICINIASKGSYG